MLPPAQNTASHTAQQQMATQDQKKQEHYNTSIENSHSLQQPTASRPLSSTKHSPDKLCPSLPQAPSSLYSLQQARCLPTTSLPFQAPGAGAQQCPWLAAEEHPVPCGAGFLLRWSPCSKGALCLGAANVIYWPHCSSLSVPDAFPT